MSLKIWSLLSLGLFARLIVDVLNINKGKLKPRKKSGPRRSYIYIVEVENLTDSTTSWWRCEEMDDDGVRQG